MHLMNRLFVCAAAAMALAGVVSALAAPAAQRATTASYHKEASIPLSDARSDLASFDAESGRVLIARSAAASLVDVAAGRARDIGTVAGGHAALAIPGTSLVAVTSGRDNSLRLLDSRDGHETARIAVGQDPDAAIWDAVAHQIIVVNTKGGTVSLVDPAIGKVVRTIKVKPALELGVKVGPNLLAINDEGLNEVEIVDLKQGKMLPPITLKGCEGPTGIAYDAADGLLLSSCANGVAALVDMRRKQLVRLLPIGAGPDTVLFDAARRRFLVPCGESGTMVVFSVNRGRQVVPAGTVTTEVGARTAALDPATGRVFLPNARFRAAEAGKRAAVVPGTSHLIVLGPS
jgi:DNA-binding beta-propeller fold protein YncE